MHRGGEGGERWRRLAQRKVWQRTVAENYAQLVREREREKETERERERERERDK